jgi:hypothetical protein
MSRLLLGAGCLQLAALFAPAARARLLGPVSFARLPNAGVALAALGALTIAAALLPRVRWRWVPGALSAAVLGVVYWRLSRAPSGTFVDPLLRHVLHPAWGFVPMTAAVVLGLVGAVDTKGADVTAPRAR